MITLISRTNSSKNLRSSKTRALDLKTTSQALKSQKPTFWRKSSKLSGRFFFGRGRFSWRRKCRMLWIQLSAKPKS
jgi:hypothetical protein